MGQVCCNGACGDNTAAREEMRMPIPGKEDGTSELKLGSPAAVEEPGQYPGYPPAALPTVDASLVGGVVQPMMTSPKLCPEPIKSVVVKQEPMEGELPPDEEAAPATTEVPLTPTQTAQEDGKAKARISTQSSGSKRRLSAIGLPFPKRPAMSCLSESLWAKCEELFRKMDQDGSNAVSREEAVYFFKGAFKKASMEAMFNEVDKDKSGAITSEEFMEFWQGVKKSGYSDPDMADEIDELMKGSTWVDWDDGQSPEAKRAEYPRRPWLGKLSKQVWAKVEALFRKIDAGGNLSINEAKADKFFQGSFTKMSVKAMFNEIDCDHHGLITPTAWIAFWVQVKGSGYKDKDILNELDGLLEGGAWVDWRDGRTT